MRNLSDYEKARIFDYIAERYTQELTYIGERFGDEDPDAIRHWGEDSAMHAQEMSNFQFDVIEYLGRISEHDLEVNANNDIYKFEMKTRAETDASVEQIKERNQRLQNKMDHFEEWIME